MFIKIDRTVSLLIVFFGPMRISTNGNLLLTQLSQLTKRLIFEISKYWQKISETPQILDIMELAQTNIRERGVSLEFHYISIF